MFWSLALVLGWLPQALADHFLHIYSSLPTIVITNNRSADRRIRIKPPNEEEQEKVQEEEKKEDQERIAIAASDVQVDAATTATSSSSPSPSAALPLLPPSASCCVSSSSAGVAASSAPIFLDWWVSWAPQRNNAGVCVTIITYNGQLRVSIVADQKCIKHTTAAKLVERYQSKIRQLAAQLG